MDRKQRLAIEDHQLTHSAKHYEKTELHEGEVYDFIHREFLLHCLADYVFTQLLLVKQHRQVVLGGQKQHRRPTFPFRPPAPHYEELCLRTVDLVHGQVLVLIQNGRHQVQTVVDVVCARHNFATTAWFGRL